MVSLNKYIILFLSAICLTSLKAQSLCDPCSLENELHDCPKITKRLLLRLKAESDSCNIKFHYHCFDMLRKNPTKVNSKKVFALLNTSDGYLSEFDTQLLYQYFDQSFLALVQYSDRHELKLYFSKIVIGFYLNSTDIETGKKLLKQRLEKIDASPHKRKIDKRIEFMIHNLETYKL